MCVGRGALGKGIKKQGAFRIFQNVQMTKTLGGSKEMEREGLKNNKKDKHLKIVDVILYMVGNYERSFKQGSDMIGFSF